MNKERKFEAKPKLELPDTVCKCAGAYYSIMEGELRCNKCNGLSPKARLVGGQFIKIK